MPKPFLLGVEIEEAAFGAVVRRINALPGVIKLHMDLGGGQKEPHKTNGSRAPQGTARRNLLRILANGKVQRTNELCAELGITSKMLRSNAGNAERAGLVKRPAKASWQITPKGKEWLKHDGEV